MPTSSSENVSELLVAWSEGDQAALDQLTPLVYDELHRLARRYMRRDSPGHTLQTSALVNEAYLKLVDQREVHWQKPQSLLRYRSAADAPYFGGPCALSQTRETRRQRAQALT